MTRRAAALAAAALTLGLVAVVFSDRASGGEETPAVAVPDWKKPELGVADVAVLISGNEKGILKPCGCSDPMMGGLPRRASFLDAMRARVKAVASVSVGETLSTGLPEQNAFKADLFRSALGSMGYAGSLLSAADLSPLDPGLSQPYGSPAETPRPPLNVKLKADGLLASSARVDPVLRFEVGGVRVRAVSVVDPTTADTLVRSTAVAEAVLPIETALKALAKEPGLLIVACHAWREDLALAARAATGLADVVVLVDVTDQVADTRPIRDAPADRPLFVGIGEYGKAVGWLRLSRRGTAWTASYDRVVLDPSLEQTESQAQAEVDTLFFAYLRRLREARLVEKWGRFQEGPRWAGSASCKECHAAVYASWEATPHALAWQTLVDREVDADPECVRCHTVGWERTSNGDWTRTETAFWTFEKTPGLVNVGCESCHGPGADHVKWPDKKELFGGWRQKGKTMWRHPGKRGCMECHDVENSYDFQKSGAYEKDYLPKIDHRDVPKDQRTVRPR